MHNESPELRALLAKIAHPSLPGIAPGLERMQALLAELGNPERKLPPTIHVAGTNGKGSTIAYMRAALEAAGKRVHVYSSPHLVHFRERIRVAGTLITDDVLIALLTRVQTATEKAPVTFFEATTAVSFLAFAENPADVLLLETGMGGRLDATNLVQPILNVITAISKDHSEFLGEELDAIAYEKAGIMKRGVPCVVAGQGEQVRDVFSAQANKVGAKLRMCGKDWQWWADGERLLLRTDAAAQPISFPQPTLAGVHQWPNAMLAAMSLLQVNDRFGLKNTQIGKGIATASWPARLQPLPRLHPIRQALPMGSQLWLDGGHNEAAAHAIADWMHGQGQKFWLIWGMLKNKDAEAFLKPLVPLLHGVIAVPVQAEMPTYTPDTLAYIARKLVVGQVMTADNPLDAARLIDDQMQEREVNALIAGSLYLAGDVLALGGAPE